MRQAAPALKQALTDKRHYRAAMADIFLSYAKQDFDRAKRLVVALEQQGWSVWWDNQIRPGKNFARVIEEELAKASCVVALWSKNSVQSHWVTIEAREGQRRDILVPALIDGVSIPFEFSSTQAAALHDWKGDSSHAQFEHLLDSVNEILGRGPTVRAVATRPESFKSRLRRLLTRGRAAVAAALILSVAAAVYFIWRAQSADTKQTTPVEIPATADLKADLVLIPGGTFMMGRNVGPPDEKPAHLVTVKPFHIDKKEVSNLEYAAFVRDINYTPPKYWQDGKPPPGQENWPVTNVSFFDALIFAAWRSARDGVIYRIPTEEEWEYAARGGNPNLYPSGDKWIDGYANVNSKSPTKPCSYPAGNRWEVCDMLGNVWEWTSTSYQPYRDTENPVGFLGFFVVRGGSYMSNRFGARDVTVTMRSSSPPKSAHETIGFRLVCGPCGLDTPAETR